MALKIMWTIKILWFNNKTNVIHYSFNSTWLCYDQLVPDVSGTLCTYITNMKLIITMNICMYTYVNTQTHTTHAHTETHIHTNTDITTQTQTHKHTQTDTNKNTDTHTHTLHTMSYRSSRSCDTLTLFCTIQMSSTPQPLASSRAIIPAQESDIHYMTNTLLHST